MEIPNKVRIGGIDYIVNKNTRPCKNDMNVDGEIIYDMGTIELREGSGECKDYQDMVFLHEVMHGIFHHMCIEQDEELIKKISMGLHQVIKDNPHIFIEKCVGGSESLGKLCAEEKGIKISKHPMCGHKLYEKQTSVPYFTKYNLCRNKETGKEFFYKSQKMDPIEMQLISVEDIFTNFIISIRDFKNNYEILEESNKCKKISPINLT